MNLFEKRIAELDQSVDANARRFMIFNNRLQQIIGSGFKRQLALALCDPGKQSPPHFSGQVFSHFYLYTNAQFLRQPS